MAYRYTKSDFGALLLLTVLTFWSATAVFAADEREADHVALRALRDKVANAISSQDADALESCVAKEFAFTAVNQVTMTNKTQIAEFFNQVFRSADAPVTSLKTEPTADIPTRFIDQNTGVCYGSSKDTYVLKSGRKVTMIVRWSATVIKQDGQWKVALAHIGTDFLNNPVLAMANSFWQKVVIGAVVGGLAIGILIGWLIFRSKKRAPAA